MPSTSAPAAWLRTTGTVKASSTPATVACTPEACTSAQVAAASGRSSHPDRMRRYLQALRHDIRGKIFLIVEGHPTHHAKKVTDFVASTNGRLTLFFLPGYSPDLNPDERPHRQVVSRVG